MCWFYMGIAQLATPPLVKRANVKKCPKPSWQVLTPPGNTHMETTHFKKGLPLGSDMPRLWSGLGPIKSAKTNNMWSVGQVGQKFYLPETQRPPVPFTQIQTQIAQRHLFLAYTNEFIGWVKKKTLPKAQRTRGLSSSFQSNFLK